MKKIVYKPRGVCSKEIRIELDDEQVVRKVEFTGGCSGNAQGVARLAEGRKAAEVIELIQGICCGVKPTSCPDQLSAALREALANA